MKTFGPGDEHPEVQVERGMLGSHSRYTPLGHTWAVCMASCFTILPIHNVWKK
jgi:hypothetical protein